VHASQQEVHTEVGDKDADERENRIPVEEIGVPERLQRAAPKDKYLQVRFIQPKCVD
jgi:hypothetical protein